jgi:hypothetical protein
VIERAPAFRGADDPADCNRALPRMPRIGARTSRPKRRPGSSRVGVGGIWDQAVQTPDPAVLPLRNEANFAQIVDHKQVESGFSGTERPRKNEANPETPSAIASPPRTKPDPTTRRLQNKANFRQQGRARPGRRDFPISPPPWLYSLTKRGFEHTISANPGRAPVEATRRTGPRGPGTLPGAREGPARPPPQASSAGRRRQRRGQPGVRDRGRPRPGPRH